MGTTCTRAEGNVSEVLYDSAAREEMKWKKMVETQFVVILLEHYKSKRI